MKIKKFKNLLFIALILPGFISFGQNSNAADNSKYSIASTEYEKLADKALKHIEKFDFSGLYDMVSEDIEYYMPDGGEESRTRFIGKDAFKGFWDTYQEKSGNNKMTASNIVTVALNVHEELKYTNITGVIVLSYFSLAMQYGAEHVDMRMNWAFHFNEGKKIDKIYSYYDRTPIIEAAKRNMLDGGGE